MNQRTRLIFVTDKGVDICRFNNDNSWKFSAYRLTQSRCDRINRALAGVRAEPIICMNDVLTTRSRAWIGIFCPKEVPA